MSKNRRNNNHNKSKLSEHFFKKDFTCKCGKCDNAFRLSLGLVGGLELLYSKVHKRINIDKGYICPECAGKTRVRKNYHALGIAADIHIPGKSLEEVFQLAETIPEFNGIGLNLTDRHIHVDTRKDRKKTLWVVKAGNYIELTEENKREYIEDISSEA